jgi:hypothetical protein
MKNTYEHLTNLIRRLGAPSLFLVTLIFLWPCATYAQDGTPWTKKDVAQATQLTNEVEAGRKYIKVLEERARVQEEVIAAQSRLIAAFDEQTKALKAQTQGLEAQMKVAQERVGILTKENAELRVKIQKERKRTLVLTIVGVSVGVLLRVI